MSIGIGVGVLAPNATHAALDTAYPNATIPATYAAACGDEGGAVCSGRWPQPGIIPSALRAPLRFTPLRRGEACPVTRGARIAHNPLVDGASFGRSPVAVVVANEVNLGTGVVQLGASDVPGWLAFKTIWVTPPSYRGPYSVRAVRLDRPGAVALQGGGGPASIVVPAGKSPNQLDGWRAVPDGISVKGPGCYGIEIDSLHTSELIVIDAVVR